MTPERRALIVAAASPQQLVDIETRPDVVIAADSGLHAVLAAGWIPDRLIGDLDSVDPAAVEIAAEVGQSTATRSERTRPTSNWPSLPPSMPAPPRSGRRGS